MGFHSSLMIRELFLSHSLSFLPSLPLSCFRKKAERGRIYFTNLQSKENTPSMINPKPCGHLCCCVIRGCEEVGGELEVLGRRAHRALGPQVSALTPVPLPRWRLLSTTPSWRRSSKMTTSGRRRR